MTHPTLYTAHLVNYAYLQSQGYRVRYDDTFHAYWIPPTRG